MRFGNRNREGFEGEKPELQNEVKPKNQILQTEFF